MLTTLAWWYTPGLTYSDGKLLGRFRIGIRKPGEPSVTAVTTA